MKTLSGICVFFLVLVATKDVQSQDTSRNFYTPFDAWRNSFTPSVGSSFWPSFHNPEPDFREAGFGSFSAEERTEGPNTSGNRDPFEIEVIESDVPSVHGATPNFFFHHSIPFFENNHPFFSTFGSFGLPKRKEPWWKGPNVCTQKEEDLEDDEPEDEEDSGEQVTNNKEIVQKPFSLFNSELQFSIDSCVEKPHKHVCKQMLSINGKKRTLTITHQCCHGFGRPRNADVAMACQKLELKSLTETADDMGAHEFIKSMKNNGLEEKLSSNITLFLPTDNAFTEFSEQMFENNLVVLPLSRSRRAIDPSGITTKELALNHIVNGWVNMDDVKNEELLPTNYENTTIRINLFPRPPNAQRFEYPFRYTANCAPLLKINKVSTNGVVHVVDRVLPPVTRNLMEIIRDREDMTILRTVLEKTKLSEMLESDKSYTIFAPTDKAFDKLDLHLRRILKDGKGCAMNILKNHILDLTFCSVAVVADAKTSAYNLMGERMSFERTVINDDQMQETEISELAGAQEILVNGQAKITDKDLMATNGVLHVVDTLMPTESALPITSLLEKKNLTVFRKLVEAANMDNDFDELNNVTFFAPSNRAFEGSYWKQKLEENPEELQDSKELKEFLNYHVVDKMTKTCDLSDKLMHTKAGSDLRVNLYSTHAVFTNVMNRATVNCARLVHFDDESCGSILHQVDKILTPPANNLLEVLQNNNDYSMFLNLVQSANLTSLLEDSNTSYTLLVPKNDVFLEVGDWYRNLLQNQADLESLIKAHIVNDVVCCAGIIPMNWPFIRTIETINNNQLLISRDRRPKIENAGITKCDIVTTNGIVHEINDIINVRNKRNNPNRHIIQSFDDILF